jgi:hypothetical protein
MVLIQYFQLSQQQEVVAQAIQDPHIKMELLVVQAVEQEMDLIMEEQVIHHL